MKIPKGQKDALNFNLKIVFDITPLTFDLGTFCNLIFIASKEGIESQSIG